MASDVKTVSPFARLATLTLAETLNRPFSQVEISTMEHIIQSAFDAETSGLLERAVALKEIKTELARLHSTIWKEPRPVALILLIWLGELEGIVARALNRL